MGEEKFCGPEAHVGSIRKYVQNDNEEVVAIISWYHTIIPLCLEVDLIKSSYKEDCTDET